MTVTISARRTLTQDDFNLFAELSGDVNPIHVDPAFSASAKFGRTVAHGMLLYSVLWGLMRQHLPEARQARQYLMFPAPCYADEELKIEINGQWIGDQCQLEGWIKRVEDDVATCLMEATWLREDVTQ